MNQQSPMIELDDIQFCDDDETNAKENTHLNKSSFNFGRNVKINNILEYSQDPKLGDQISVNDQDMKDDLDNLQQQYFNNTQNLIYGKQEQDQQNENREEQQQEKYPQKQNQTPSQADIEEDFNNFRNLMKKKTIEVKDRSSNQEYMITPNQNNSVKRVMTYQDDNVEKSDDNFGLIQFLKKKQQNINNQFKVIIRTLNIKKFMNIMKGKSKKFLFRWMSQLHFEIIGDVASDYDYFYYQRAFHSKAIFKRGLIITRRKIIVSEYLKNKFPIFDVLKKYTELDERFNKNKQVSVTAKIIKLVFIMLMVGHLSACCFVEIGQIEKNLNQNSWLNVSTNPSDGWFDIYITAIYWATITMVTLGYGDIVPVTSIERVFVIFMSLSSCGIFAYSFNQIGEIIQEMQKSKAEFQQKMRMLNYLMSKRAIDTQLQTRIRKYYEYYYQQKYQSDLDINHVIENLSSILKEEVFRDLYGKKLSPEVIDSLALRVKEKKFVAEEYIFQEKDHDDKIYILIQGELELVSKENGRTYTLLKRYKREEIIGEEEFFNESLRQYSLKACNSSLVAFLTRQDFYEVLQKYPEQYEFYRQLKDKIMLFNQHQTLGIKCIICDKYSHKYDKCPFLNLEERKHMVIHNSNKSYDQKRVKVKRFQQRYNSRNNQAVVQNAMHLFEVEYESRLNLRTDSEISQTYEGYEVKTRSKVVLSQVEFNPINSQVNNIFLHEPLGSFCNFKNELSSYKDNISQMEKSDKEDILSQVSLRGMQLQNNQQTQQPSQLLLLQPSSQPQTLQVLIDYKSEVSNKGKRNSDLIQIKLPVQGNQAQKTQPINSNQIGQQLVTNAQNNPNQQIISLNFDQLQNQKNLKQNNESFTDLEQSSHNQQNFQRKDDKKKSTRIIKRSSIAQQDSLPSGLNAIISSSNNQLYVNRQGTRNQTFHQNERKNTINEKSQTSQMQNGLIFYLEFCQFDYEQIFDIGKDFKKYFVSNNPQNIIKAYNYSQFKNRSKQKTQNQRKSKKKIASPSKPRKSCKYVKSPQSVIANSQPQI